MRMIRRIGYTEAAKLLGRAAVLDVRDPAEYRAGRLPGAVSLPADDLTAAAAAAVLPDKSAPVLVYCRTGKRSAEAARILDLLGYRAVYDLGGFAGKPFEAKLTEREAER